MKKHERIRKQANPGGVFGAICLTFALVIGYIGTIRIVNADTNGSVSDLQAEVLHTEGSYQSVAPIIEDNSGSVYDLADLLYEEEIEYLEELIDEVEEKKDYRIVVVTTDENPGTSMAYADDFTDFNGFGPDCILFLLDMDNREQWISTTGVCTEDSGVKKSSFSQSDIENILDETTPWASQGNYYKCLESFVKEVKYHENLLHTLIPTGLSIIISIVLSVLVFVVMIVQHKVKAPANIANYKMETKTFRVGTNRAVFLGTQTFKKRIPKSNGGGGHGGGGGGMHVGGSGTSHGGGGRGF